MIQIGLNNVEELILKDSRLKSLLPNLQSYFDTWFLGQNHAALRSLASRTKLDLLYALNTEHIAIISKHLESEVSVRTFDPNIVKNCDCVIEDVFNCLDGLAEHSEIAVFRDCTSIHITAWR